MNALTPAEIIETLVLCCFQGTAKTAGNFGTAELEDGTVTFTTSAGVKGRAWTGAHMGEGGGCWKVQIEGQEPVGPDYLLDAAKAALQAWAAIYALQWTHTETGETTLCEVEAHTIYLLGSRAQMEAQAEEANADAIKHRWPSRYRAVPIPGTLNF